MARRLARWVLNRADAVTAPAQPLLDRAAFFAGDSEKVHLIHWGVDCQVFVPESNTDALRASLDIPDSAPVLLCPRGLRPVYDIETVLRATKQVIKVEPRALLLLIDFNARPDYRNKIDQWIQAWKLAEHVRFLPRINSRKQMAALYRSASLVISLPVSDSLSLTVLEAMACGTPVVVSDLRSYEGWVIDGETGYAVPPRDASAAANAILSLLKSVRKSSQVGERCRSMVCERAGLRQQVENALALYHTLL
jgi:glycosyltransferase involved in cell wall biosynthesis